MTAPLTIYLLRHGEVYNPEKILYGRLPGFGLSDTGRQQAQAAARHLLQTSVAAIYASPMQRAQETAAIVAEAHPDLADIITDERINECYSPYDGTSQAELQKIQFDLYTGTEEQYEKPADLRRRLMQFFATMREKHASQAIAAVSHGDIVVSAFLHAKSYDINSIGRHRDNPDMTGLLRLGLPDPYPATASISTLRFHTDDPDEIPEYAYVRPYEAEGKI